MGWIWIAGCGQTVIPEDVETGSIASAGSTTGTGSSAGSGGRGAGGGSGECETIEDCVAAGVPECMTAVACEAGVCVLENAPAGEPLADPTPGDCATVVCDGKGRPQVAPQPGDIEDDGKACTLDACDGTSPLHTPLAAISCYTGPAGTLGVGVCAAGAQTCDAQGEPVGVCEGEVTPGVEACDVTGVDEDCDGEVNEQDAGCCGDGQVTFGEVCDDGNADPDDGCTPLCKPPECGDGYLQPALGEQCDDGATSDGDPCSPTCQEQYVVFVDVGAVHSCALLNDGRVKCWGWASVGQLGLGSMQPHGQPAGTMGDDLPAVDLGTGRTAVAISVGYAHACAVLDDGSAKCWGQNADGQLGLGDTETRGDEPGEMGDNLPAIDLGTGRTAVAIAAGTSHTCALLDDASVKCWGNGSQGQLGLGDTDGRGDQPGEMGDDLPAVNLGTGKTAAGIVAGGSHNCAVLTDGNVKCWGYNLHGALGIGDQFNRGVHPNEMGDNLPVLNLDGAPVTAVAAGNEHTCALLAGGVLKCWGSNGAGTLGLGDTEDRGDEPFEMSVALPAVDVGTGKQVVAVATGEYHTCAVLSDETVRCWGDGSYGRLGNESTNGWGYLPSHMGNNLPAVNLGTGKHVAGVAAMVEHSCALLTDGSLRCWGNNGNGQCGFSNPSIAGSQPGTMGDNLPPTKLFSDQW